MKILKLLIVGKKVSHGQGFIYTVSDSSSPEIALSRLATRNKKQ